MDRTSLAADGRERVKLFCTRNKLTQPALVEPTPNHVDRMMARYYHLNSCGFYRRQTIHVMVDKCAHPGRSGMSWSWPGYVIDRTPFGVYAHELGHYVDEVYSKPGASVSGQMRERTKEPAITGYCPNDSEWFAEIFRLFVTNPDYLSLFRPRTYHAVLGLGLIPVETRNWRAVLAEAPARTVAMADKKLMRA